MTISLLSLVVNVSDQIEMFSHTSFDCNLFNAYLISRLSLTRDLVMLENVGSWND